MSYIRSRFGEVTIVLTNFEDATSVGMGLHSSDGFSRDVWAAAMESWPDEAAELNAAADAQEAAIAARPAPDGERGTAS